MKQSTKLFLLLGLTLLPYCCSEATTSTYACERNTRIARSKVASTGRSCDRLLASVQRYKTEVVSRKAALTKRIEAQITTANDIRKKYLTEYLKLSVDALEKRYNGENGLVAKGQVRATQGCKKASDASDALKKIIDGCPVISVPVPTPTPTSLPKPTSTSVTTTQADAVKPGAAVAAFSGSSTTANTAVYVATGTCTGSCAQGVRPVTVSSNSVCTFPTPGGFASNYPCYEITTSGYVLRINSGSGSSSSPITGTAPTGAFTLPNNARLVSIANIGFTPVDATQDFGSFYNSSRFNVADTSTYVTYEVGNQVTTVRAVELPNYAPAICKEESARAISGGSNDPCSMRSGTNSQVCLGYWDTAKCN